MQEFHLPSRSLFCRSSRRSTCRLGRSRVSYGHIAQKGTTQTQLVFSTTTLTYINRNAYSINTIRICLGAWTKMISSSTFLECSGITNAKTCWQPKNIKSLVVIGPRLLFGSFIKLCHTHFCGCQTRNILVRLFGTPRLLCPGQLLPSATTSYATDP